ncbi:uncharacterized protein LTR77_003377 [Saxophila tyrrhenica]|uniref:Uncharacterized protein n=1 Tax=Saxophila tyrrhenica TaxID=1690608 RepID=A0AAV9PDI4_9PEZI|nr:hypothetical protein LTR77_003377 [Saxophila tyrrhenica]
MPDPEPFYAFTVPSLADDLPLQCRVYHPKTFGARLQPQDERHSRRRGAIVAHPYAPLGGCYDDPVVLSVAETLLGEGYVVGTFNFRGAGESGGHTTWSGKAEQDDYVSLAGFMINYLRGLAITPDSDQLEPIQSITDMSGKGTSTISTTLNNTTAVQLILGGYSYGSLILARLPPVQSIIRRFEDAQTGTAAAEIVLRAKTMAEQNRNALQEAESPATPQRGRQLDPNDVATSPRKRVGASPIVFGGEESDPSSRRRSRDSRRSNDIVRKSIETPRRIKAHMRGSSLPAKNGVKVETTSNPVAASPRSPAPALTVRYLVISPVLLPFTSLLLPPGPPSVFAGLRKRSEADTHAGDLFIKNPTLALFGSSDVLTASKRLKAWAEKLSASPKSSFTWEEIEGAGHFWHEPGVMQALQEKIKTWVANEVDS